MKLNKSAYGYIMMVGHLCADMCGGALPAILPFLMSARGISYASAAGLTFAYSSVGSIIQPIFGSMADKTSRPWLMSFGIILSGVSMAVLGFLESYWAMFTAAVLIGIGSALFHPDGGRMANYVSGEAKGKGMSIFSVGGNLGGAFGPILAVFAISTFGLKGTAVFAIPTVLMAAFLFSQSSRFAAFAIEGSKKTAAAMAAGQKDDWNSFFKLSGVVFLRSSVATGISTFIPLLWLNILMQTESASGTITSVIAFSGAVATLIGGRLSDKIGFSKVIRGALAFLVPSIALIALSRNIILSTIIIIPLSMFLYAAYSPCVALGQKFVPNHIGLASGITMGLATSFGGMMSPLLGKIADTQGLIVVLWVLVGITAVTCLVSFTVPDAPKDIVLPGEDAESGKAN